MAQWAESLIRARYLVGSLGEDVAVPWWSTTVTSPIGRRMLSRMFPRTVLHAGLETVSRAASNVHDQQIGRLGAYHLFRLPVAVELAITEVLRMPESEEMLQIVADLPNREARLTALASLTAGDTVPNAYGPMHVGSPTGLRRGRTLQRLCAAYLSAFTAESTAFPYLLEVLQP